MNLVRAFFGSSIGKKWVIALTAIVLLGYVIGHLAGNLQIFAGPEKINAYAAFLPSMPGALWAVRVVLIAAFVLHIVMTLKLAAENRGAHNIAYKRRNSVQAKLATRTMALSGLIVLAFVLYHLAQFTVRITDARFHSLPRGEFDVYTMVILGFQNFWVSGFYVVAVFLLCLHLSHGLQSMCQTLGVNSRRLRPVLMRGGQLIAWVIFLGYISIPVAVLANVLKV
ncbi:MAG TPA: succinate dehydrogenase cytochrome b subunit [Chthoniobacteraceae bacterium]|nr:succinate dehydrogenase cytochrome b subunit [Chthoniobacteraceae bacterium]